MATSFFGLIAVAVAGLALAAALAVVGAVGLMPLGPVVAGVAAWRLSLRRPEIRPPVVTGVIVAVCTGFVLYAVLLVLVFLAVPDDFDTAF
jgi:hypothetical protein